MQTYLKGFGYSRLEYFRNPNWLCKSQEWWTEIIVTTQADID